MTCNKIMDNYSLSWQLPLEKNSRLSRTTKKINKSILTPMPPLALLNEPFQYIIGELLITEAPDCLNNDFRRWRACAARNEISLAHTCHRPRALISSSYTLLSPRTFNTQTAFTDLCLSPPPTAAPVCQHLRLDGYCADNDLVLTLLTQVFQQ